MASKEKLLIAEIKETWDKMKKSLDQKKQNMVAFIGPTKAGKSTLINAIMGTPLISKIDSISGETFIYSPESNFGPKIGRSGESETLLPQGYANIPDTDSVMWDFPGFYDNKSLEQEIANAKAYDEILKVQKSVRFVLVVPIEIIANDNPMDFFKIINGVNNICPKIESLCLVSTKSEKGNIRAWLQKTLNSTFCDATESNTAIVESAKNTIRNLMERCIDFKAPKMKENDLEQNFQPPNLGEIIKLIKSLNGTVVKNSSFIISDEAKHKILQLYMACNNELRRKVDEQCGEINKYFEKTINSIQSVNESYLRKLTRLHEGKKTIDSVRGGDLGKIFTQLKKLGVPITFPAEDVENFTYVENICRTCGVGMAEDGLIKCQDRIMLTLRNVFQNYAVLISDIIGGGFLDAYTTGHSYNKCYKMRSSNDGRPRLEFYVKTKSDAHVLIMSDKTHIKSPKSATCLEIVIGAGQNKFSTVRLGSLGRDQNTAQTPGMLSADEYRGFWIKLTANNNVEVGQLKSHSPFLTASIPSNLPLGRMHFFGLSSWYGIVGDWIVQVE